MRVITQERGQSIPFEKFVFAVNRNKIIASPDIIGTPMDIEVRGIATYKDYETAKDVLEDMNNKYMTGTKVYEMPLESEVENERI